MEVNALYSKQSNNRLTLERMCMKRYCKNANILDFEFLEFCAGECLRKKWKRRDVLGFFSDITGRSKDDVR